MATNPKLADLLKRNAPVLDSLYSFLTIADVQRLHRVCKAFWWLSDDIRSRLKTKLKTKLKQFVDEPQTFLQQLKVNRGLVHGLFVLNVLTLNRSQDRFLDVHVEHGAPFDSFADYLENTEHYVLQSIETKYSIYGRGSATATTIRLRAYNGAPGQAILNSSFTTADVNVISWNKIYSVFPSMTIDDHEFYPLKPLDDSFGVHLKELSRHGWTTRDLRWPDTTTRPLRGSGQRRFGDSLSLVFQLGDDSMELKDLEITMFSRSIEYSQFDVIEVQLPRLGFGRAASNGGMNPIPFPRSSIRMEVNEVASPALRFRYTCGDKTHHKSWFQFIEERLRRWALVELFKMSPEGRPNNFANAGPPQNFRISLPSGFEAPKDWDYADDQMPPWFDFWEKQKDPA
ncbi:hypothetical protein D7B24_003095 [Verticillium nonalfalfae]|uniref:F-box domain-containing protein n=1 Tax=Verticillium nonalfalfae TaxID=1051616 RepID=A0A3M9XXE5_9PEZI|nr:uncharacterized protein D7B24_003095 [Verticillium nonalfalfae]RNJ52674.1 hypothetical protein D7B24_003095 [Verticillium nonalfalfae]